MYPSSGNIDDLLCHHRLDDPVIIEAMIGQYHPMLYRLTLSILNDPVEAEDAVQEAFLKAALHLGRYIPGTNFKAWLFSIAINTCKGYLRKMHSRQNLETLLRSLHFITPTSPTPEQTTLENERGAQLWSMVSKLSDKYRLVVILRIVYELPVSEIAYILGIKEKTVYSRLYDAFHKLREQLGSFPDYEWVDKELP